MACIVSTANKPLVGTLMTIGDITRNIDIMAEVKVTFAKASTTGVSE